jgi:recombination protein RecR
MLPEPIKKFIEVFSRLPAIGPRMATRLSFYLSNLDKNSLKELEDALGNLKKISRCPNCFFLKSGGHLCSICSDEKRDKSLIAVLEKDTDLLSIEKTGNFKGLYLIIGELNEREGLGSAHKLRIKHLKERIKRDLGGPSTGSGQGKAKELILALNPTAFGNFVSDLIRKELENNALKITRLGRGIPTGGEIEFADEETLSQALERRN